MIEAFATKFGRVFIPAVVGNHGRSTLKGHYKQRAYTNYDWTIACNLERVFRKDKNIQFQIPSGADARFNVFGTRFLLTHGDTLGVRGGDGIIGLLGPLARGRLKVGQSEAAIGRDFDMLLCGHYHQLTWLPNLICNGCVKGYDEYARLALRAPYSPPAQALFFTHPEHGVTARWPAFLEPKKVIAQENVWTSWQT
jgi:predicted phosphodiesterase